MRFCIHGILPSIAPRASSWRFLKFLEFFRVVVVVSSQGILGVHGIHEILPFCCCGEVDGPSWNSWNSWDFFMEEFRSEVSHGNSSLRRCDPDAERCDPDAKRCDPDAVELADISNLCCCDKSATSPRFQFSVECRRVKFIKFLLFLKFFPATCDRQSSQMANLGC